MTTFNGKINGNGLKIGIVVARFNAFVTQQLLTGGTRKFGTAWGQCNRY